MKDSLRAGLRRINAQTRFCPFPYDARCFLSWRRRRNSRVRFEWADLRQGLLSAGERFELIVADRSLRYFPWHMTAAFFKDAADRLAPGGLLAGRFNPGVGPNHHPATPHP